MKKTIALLLTAVILLGAAGCGADEDAKNTSAPGGQSEVSQAKPEKKEHSATLTAGIYTVGVDIPAGTYDLTAQSGSGNVSSSNLYDGGVNELMGVKDNDLYQETFQGAKLTDGVTFKIGGTLTLKIDTKEADTGSMKKRNNPASKEYTFSSGNYTCGDDFEPGEYVITAVSGSGNVSSDNLLKGGINEIMSEEAGELYISSFQNANFEDGVKLAVSGVKIKLTPSK